MRTLRAGHGRGRALTLGNYHWFVIIPVSSQSPVVKMKERVNLLFPALKIIGDFGGDAEAATVKNKIRQIGGRL